MFIFCSKDGDHKKIAEELSISREVIYLHLANARKKLNAHNSIELLYIISKNKNFDNTRIKLSPRGCEVFQLIIIGLTNRQIATYLKISQSTVRKHKEKMLSDNECTSMIELVSKYYIHK